MKQRNERQWALNQMAEWLFHSREFGEKPVKQQIIYEREVSWPWEENPVKIFLIKYRMKKGFEGIGLTGPTTWSFADIKDWTALTPEDFVYCYVGWYIYFFFIDLQGFSRRENREKAEQFVANLIEQGIVEPRFYKVCDVFQIEEDLIYYAIEFIKNGEQVYLVGTPSNYIFYSKDFPPMQLPPFFYFLGKTFNPFREA